MVNKRIIFIGPCGGGGVPKDGASGKNYHFLNYIKKLRSDIRVIDTANWKKHPKVLLKLLWTIVLNKKSNYILATDNLSSYRVITFFSLLPNHRYLIYWMIGGSMPTWIKEGRVKRNPFRTVDWFVVEGRKMIETMKDSGFENNVLYVPNFKNIYKIPDSTIHKYKPVRFVFLSRIIPEKGCVTILDAAQKLSEKFSGLFTIDFYGPIDNSFHDEFVKRYEEIDGVKYNCFLDLRDVHNYEVLEKYDVMLFPTFWHGEGFPGIIVDAYIAGLPIVASDWSLNSEIIDEGKTGFLISPHNVDALVNKMSEIIENPSMLLEMSNNCREKALNYSIDHVVTEELLQSLGI